MVITINSDASHSKKYKVGTYACHIVCDQFRLSKSGWLKNPAESSNEAEAAAIANALYLIKANIKKINPITRLVINTDSLTCCRKINRKAKQGTIYYEAYILLREIRYLSLGDKPERTAFWKLKHVSAHIAAKDRAARHHVNEWCDREARIQMGKRLELIKRNEGVAI